MPDTEPSSESAMGDVERVRQCAACGAALAGPFEPVLSLVKATPAQRPEQEVAVTIQAWVCPGCGLAHWYVLEQDLEQLEGVSRAGEGLAPKPGSSYERRMQVLHALRRVRRM
jgi:hypothetical protein